MVLGPWELPPGAFSGTLSFLFILFRFCIVLVIFPCFALKMVIGNYQKDFFLEPFSFFRVFFHFRFHFRFFLFFLFPFSFSFFSCFFRFVFRFGYVSSFAFKIDLRNCQKELFLEPFFFRFFLFWLFLLLCLQN